MLARIYKPAKTSMQGGLARTKRWVLEFEQETPRSVEPLMGWVSSDDTRRQVILSFDTKEEAIAYAERNSIPYRVFDPNAAKVRKVAYSDNFRFGRMGPWTH